MAINGLFFSQLVHHHFGDGIPSLAPNVDHFVVTLTRGHQTGDVLLFDFFDLFFSFRNQAVLLLRDQHVVNRNGDTRASGQAETVLEQAICKHHGLLQSTLPERGVDQARNFFLLQSLVHVAERQALGQYFRQERTTHGGLNHRGVWGEFTGHFVLDPLGHSNIDLGGQLHHIGVQSALHFGHIGEDHALTTSIDALTGGVVKTQHHVL